VSIDLDTGEIAGYYSLAAWSIARAEVGGGWLARNAPDPGSVILLGRLAISVHAQSHGLGRDLVADALRNAHIGARALGARALVAEAIDGTAEQFYSRLGFWQSSARHDLFAIRLAP
jgi:predicted N-acetyltransferase YhbS